MPRETLLQVLVKRVGFFHAGRILSFVIAWLVAEAEMSLSVDTDEGHEFKSRFAKETAELEAGFEHARRRLQGEDVRTYTLTVEDYAAFWKQARSAAFKEQARFRKAFEPEGLLTPSDLVAFLEPANRAITEPTGLGLALWPSTD